jgi:DNA invertase Pin-like site-specific DNA recombinase
MTSLTPAAQYLRVSTESQVYSLDNQRIAIQEWAALHGFEIVMTYADPGKSGVVLRNRVLRTLLTDVTSGKATYKAVLVYDVSRWGRFQDLDEAAHYEFLCKSTGIPVYYCAEAFSGDPTMPNLILKALKRSMAAEYSRDLGERTFYRQRKAAEQGFWVGSTPGYGFRRLLMDARGRVKHLLKHGERKSVQSDRIRIVLGPQNEIDCVRHIYEMVIRSKGKVRLTEIAQELNRREIRYFGKRWEAQTVKRILTSPKYYGQLIWGRTARKLHGTITHPNPSEWVSIKDAIPAIVSRRTFQKVQELRVNTRVKLSQDKILRRCASILKRKGRLSQPVLNSVPGSPSAATIYKYFGDMWNLYRHLNYQPQDSRVLRECERQHTVKIRNDTLNKIASLCPLHMDVIEPAPGLRRLLFVDRVLSVSVLICRRYESNGGYGWIAMPHRRERDLMTLLCLMNADNTEPTEFYLARRFPVNGPYFRFHLATGWLKEFRKIVDLRDLYWDTWELQGESPIASPRQPASRYSAFWVPEVVKLS